MESKDSTSCIILTESDQEHGQTGQPGIHDERKSLACHFELIHLEYLPKYDYVFHVEHKYTRWETLYSMAEKETSGAENRLSLRLTDGELERFTRLQERLQERLGPNIRATQKATFLEALERLEAHFAKLDKDKGRNR